MQSTFTIERIEPGQTIEFQVVVTMNPEVMFFDRKMWRATLILRDRPIAFVEDKVRYAAHVPFNFNLFSMHVHFLKICPSTFILFYFILKCFSLLLLTCEVCAVVV
jgi:hypothetical protein